MGGELGYPARAIFPVGFRFYRLGRWGCRAGRPVRRGYWPPPSWVGPCGEIKRLACDSTRRRGARVRGEEGRGSGAGRRLGYVVLEWEVAFL